MAISATKIEKQGRDLLIDEYISVPKDHVIIYLDNARESVMVNLLKPEYSVNLKSFQDLIEFKWGTCLEPTATSTQDLFDKISKLKKPT